VTKKRPGGAGSGPGTLVEKAVESAEGRVREDTKAGLRLSAATGADICSSNKIKELFFALGWTDLATPQNSRPGGVVNLHRFAATLLRKSTQIEGNWLIGLVTQKYPKASIPRAGGNVDA
jgi:hypothetical protein